MDRPTVVLRLVSLGNLSGSQTPKNLPLKHMIKSFAKIDLPCHHISRRCALSNVFSIEILGSGFHTLPYCTSSVRYGWSSRAVRGQAFRLSGTRRGLSCVKLHDSSPSAPGFFPSLNRFWSPQHLSSEKCRLHLSSLLLLSLSAAAPH